MTINYQTQRETVPVAYVTKGRQRVKQFSGHGNGSVYLRNGDEFELELFNPTTSKVLAKISLNGKSLGSGIVLRPGERVFLERYFDEAKKFLFETYVVDGNDPNVKEAIKMNGLVEVEFYDEYKPIPINWGTVTYQPSWGYNNGNSGGYYNSCPTFTAGNTLNSGGVKSSKAEESFELFSCSCSLQDSKSLEPPASMRREKLEETGRVEKGSNSNQSFVYDSTTFNTYYTWKSSWTILPDSQRPIVIEDLKVFCTNCGKRRRKSSDAFCSKCGTKF